MQTAAIVTVLVAVHDGERFVQTALDSILRQDLPDLELLVVDDGSSDSTPEILEGVSDSRLRVVRNDERSGLAAALNRGLDEAHGRYVARMDADDVALPNWLERSLDVLRSGRETGFVGAGVLDIDAADRVGEMHVLERGHAPMRWRALWSAPIFHNTAVVDRDLLEQHRLRYDPAYGESEDYDLWTRVLEVSEGDSVEEPLVLHRLHPEQASRRRSELQSSLALQISLRQLEALAPEMPSGRAELARRLALGAELAPADAEDAADALGEVLDRFCLARPYSSEELRPVRRRVARAIARASLHAEGSAKAALLTRAGRLDPALPAHVALLRARRRMQSRYARREAALWLAELAPTGAPRPLRVAAVFPEPTPYRAPLLDRIAALQEIDLTVIYAAPTVARRTWNVEPSHHAVFLRGLRVPGAERVLHHDYPVTPGIARALEHAQPEVVVVSGWSTFAAQSAIAWCRLRKVPYVLVVESHDEGPRPGWRRTVKGTVVPPIVRGAAGALVTGTLARRSMIDRGAPPERVHVFANTIDVEAFGQRADRLAARRPDLRLELGAGPDDIVVLSVARLVPEKAHDVLVRAIAAAQDPRLLLVLVGDGPEREALAALARDLGVRVLLAGDRPWERIAEVYVAADVFALLSEREPWAVVVNEAAACGLPLVLSDRVGAAHDLLHDGENGVLVAAGDVGAAAEALRRLAADTDGRRRMGVRSRELVRDWGYGPSVKGFLAAVHEAVSDTG